MHMLTVIALLIIAIVLIPIGFAVLKLSDDELCNARGDTHETTGF